MKNNTLFLDQHAFKLIVDELQLIKRFTQESTLKPEHIILTFNDVKEKMKVDDKTLRGWCDNEGLEFYLVGRLRFFTLQFLLDFLKTKRR